MRNKSITSIKHYKEIKNQWAIKLKDLRTTTQKPQGCTETTQKHTSQRDDLKASRLCNQNHLVSVRLKYLLTNYAYDEQIIPMIKPKFERELHRDKLCITSKCHHCSRSSNLQVSDRITNCCNYTHTLQWKLFLLFKEIKYNQKQWSY